MEKKIGKGIFLFLLQISWQLIGSAPAIILRLQDSNQQAITQAMQRVPFMLQVELKNIDGDVRSVAGIEQFTYSRGMVSNNVYIENGVKTTRKLYNFTLKSDKPGTYLVGPLELKDATGRSVRSNLLKVVVGDQVVSSDSSAQDKYFLTCKLDTTKAYVGQRVPLKVQFYDRVYVEGLEIIVERADDFFMPDRRLHPKSWTANVAGVDYAVAEWSYDMYPTQPGQLIIHDVCANFFDPRSHGSLHHGSFFSMLNPFVNTPISVHAKPVSLQVIPLPVQAGFEDVTAIGQFDKIVVSSQQTTALAGQGIEFKIELFGQGNFDVMLPLALQLPEGCNYYDSNTKKFDFVKGYQLSEFILQIQEPGHYHIDGQKFNYFDPVEGCYKTLMSNALDLTILPNDQIQKNKELEKNNFELQDEEQLPVESKTFLQYPIITIKDGSTTKPWMICLAWYSFILWLFNLVFAGLAIYQYLFVPYLFTHAKWRKFIIFFTTKRALYQSEQKHDVKALHQIFMQIFAHLAQVHEGALDGDQIIQYLQNKEFADQQIVDWKNFYTKIVKISFADHDQIDIAHLYQDAWRWFNLLKEQS